MHTKKHSRKTRGKKHRGGYYGAAGPIPGAGGAPAGMRWGSAQEVATPSYAKGGKRKGKRGGMGFCPPDMSAPGSNGKCEDGSDPLTQAGRRRRSMKKKSKGKRKTMRGGNRFGAVSASFQGKGIGGMANYTGVNTKTGPSALGAWNDNGAKPGSPFP